MEILEFFVSTAFVTALLVFLGKTIIDRAFDKRMEEYKNALTKDLEDHKANLRIAELEHEIKYSRLNQERGEVIKRVYELLTRLENWLTEFYDALAGKNSSEYEDVLQTTNDIHGELKFYFRKNKIYFSNSLCAKIDNIIQNSDTVITDGTVTKFLKSITEASEYDDEFKIELLKISAKLSNEIPVAKKEIEFEFRTLLGVETK